MSLDRRRDNLPPVMLTPPRARFAEVRFLASTARYLLFCACIAATFAGEPPATPPAYRTGWIGNTFSGTNGKWVQNNIPALFVAADGACYTDSYWDEAGHEAGIYKNGDVLGGCADAHGHGGFAVTADEHNVYIAYRLNDHFSGIRRYDLSGNSAPFAGGAGDGSFLPIGSSPTTLRGMAVSGGELYVSDYDANTIRVYTASTMTPARTFPLDRPTRIAADAAGSIWIIQARQGDAAARIVRCTVTGHVRKQAITDVVDPVALSIDGAGRLLVADNGPAQQVRIYDQITSVPHLAGTIGEEGGIFSGTRGLVGPLRFNGLTGVGADASGNVYVSHNGLGPYFADHPGFGVELKCLTFAGASWKLQWNLQGLEFVDMAEPDPASETDVFTKNQHFTMDYSKPPGQEWAYHGQTLDRFAYPDDPRLQASSECVLGVRRILGKRFLYLTNMYASFVSIYRWDEANERFIPSGLIAREPFKSNDFEWPPYQPRLGDWIWRDANGDGRFDPAEYDRHVGDNQFVWGWQVDAAGTIWKAMRESGIRRFPMQGLDAYGNPIYTYASSELIPNPSPFDTLGGFRGDVNRIEYDSATDMMVLAGYTFIGPSMPGEWGQVGRVICRYDNWSKGERTLNWEIHPPYDAKTGATPKAMSLAGDYLFLTYLKQPQVLIYDIRSGALVATLTPGPEVGGNHVGWVDVPYGIKAFKRANGEYLIFNEEDWRGKILMYRWSPG